MNIFEEVKRLGLSKGDYVAVGGGTLVALDLLEWDEDIDLAVTPEVFAWLNKSKGWRHEEWKGKAVLKQGVYDVGVGFGRWSLAELLADALWIQDIPFMGFNKLMAWKKEMGREKDLQHMALIQTYLNKAYKLDIHARR